jgi:hypothetical protein
MLLLLSARQRATRREKATIKYFCKIHENLELVWLVLNAECKCASPMLGRYDFANYNKSSHMIINKTVFATLSYLVKVDRLFY